MSAIDDAFRWARIHAARHMTACDDAGLRWGETAITEIVTAYAARAVSVVPFTQRAEALTGADWVWWWVDGAAAYGMLVQAKRVTVAGTKWSFGFGYKAKGATRSQRDVLHSSAKALDLLPVYSLYLGTGDYRGWARCGALHRPGRCLSCVKRTVSLMPALLAEEWLVDDSISTYERSVALEDLQTSAKAGAPLIPALKSKLAPELLDFLLKRQGGTRAIVRSMIDPVLRARFGAFSEATAGVITLQSADHDQLGPIFSEVPDDTGHWSQSYFEHLLNPLRAAPPDYVLEITSGDFDEKRLALEMPDNIAGIIVARVSTG